MTSMSHRVLHLPPQVVVSLRALRAGTGGVGPVFTTGEGGHLRDNAIRNAFGRAFKDAELPWSGTHICRHTFGALALVSTGNLSAVQAAMGHADIRETQLYAKATACLDKTLAEKTAATILSASLTKSLTQDTEDTKKPAGNAG